MIGYIRGMDPLMPKCCFVLAVTTCCSGKSRQRALVVEWSAGSGGVVRRGVFECAYHALNGGL